jgi:hypothetical protein
MAMGLWNIGNLRLASSRDFPSQPRRYSIFQVCEVQRGGGGPHKLYFTQMESAVYEMESQSLKSFPQQKRVSALSSRTIPNGSSPLNCKRFNYLK